MNTQENAHETAQEHAHHSATDDRDASMSAAVDSARATVDAASLLARSATASARAGGAAVRQQLEQRPYVTLGIVAGVGFVAAGGLASPAVWGLARLGARAALAYATRKLGEVVLATPSTPSTPSTSPSGTTRPTGSNE